MAVIGRYGDADEVLLRDERSIRGGGLTLTWSDGVKCSRGYGGNCWPWRFMEDVFWNCSIPDVKKLQMCVCWMKVVRR